mmetsp:Transcript_16106/g.23666  ORF Transcript_16106/g.23666 Transcript_16106/m.23666 type:complete len:213 (-) Transcript_16106:149-787(-)
MWKQLILTAIIAVLTTSTYAFLPTHHHHPNRINLQPSQPTFKFTNVPTPPPPTKIHSQQHQYKRHTTSALSSFNLNSGGGAQMDPGLKLLICIVIDLVGVSSFAAPGVGEVADVGWAPISALLINYLFGNGVFTALALVEELSPGLDIIPTATIAWFLENAAKESNASSSGGGDTMTPPPPPPVERDVTTPPSSSSSKRPDMSKVIDADIVD